MKLGNEGKITIGHRKLQNIVVTTISTALPFAFGAVLVRQQAQELERDGS